MVSYEFIFGRKINPIMGQPNSIWLERAAKGQCKSLMLLRLRSCSALWQLTIIGLSLGSGELTPRARHV